MLRGFCFDGLGLTIEDMYFFGDSPDDLIVEPGREAKRPRRGIRIDLRTLEPQIWRGSFVASQKIVMGRIVWRADLLQPVEGGPGSKERMHCHPIAAGNAPSASVFSKHLSEAPIEWLGTQLADPFSLLEAAGINDLEGFRGPADQLRRALPELLDIADAILTEVHTTRPGLMPSTSRRG